MQKKELKAYKYQINKNFETEIITLSKPLSLFNRCSKNQENFLLYTMISDAILTHIIKYQSVDLAFINIGSVRKGLPSGFINKKQLFDV
jgi:2',3'-cyclic-nucleotide 2'-phosphodiesterase (5'-nucleotidase family)